jgi:hypothetical protein
MSDEDAFRAWAREVIDATAAQLVETIPGATLGKSRTTKTNVSTYVHFTDVKLPQSLAIWLYSAFAGGRNNFKGHPDSIVVGLKQDEAEELDQDVGRFRLRATRFNWREHISKRDAGWRLIEPAAPMRDKPVAETADALTTTVLGQLRRAAAIA